MGIERERETKKDIGKKIRKKELLRDKGSYFFAKKGTSPRKMGTFQNKAIIFDSNIRSLTICRQKA